MNVPRWSVIVSTFQDFSAYPHCYSPGRSCSFRVESFIGLGKAVLLSFLIITHIHMFPVYFFGKNFFLWFNKLKKSFPQFFEHEQMVLFCVFLRVLCLPQQGSSYVFNIGQLKNMKNKSGHIVWSLHRHLYITRCLLCNLVAFVWTFDSIRTERIWAHILLLSWKLSGDFTNLILYSL